MTTSTGASDRACDLCQRDEALRACLLCEACLEAVARVLGAVKRIEAEERKPEKFPDYATHQ